MRAADLKKTIREIPDFPKPGIKFYDVSTLFRDPAAFRLAIDVMVERYRGQRLDALACIEARGFILASAMAYHLELGIVLIRKKGKLPHATESESYSLEYGEATVEVHRDAVEPGQRVVVIDDVLATGGTASASGRLLTRLGAKVDGYGFLLELKGLAGRKALGTDEVFSLMTYD